MQPGYEYAREVPIEDLKDYLRQECAPHGDFLSLFRLRMTSQHLVILCQYLDEIPMKSFALMQCSLVTDDLSDLGNALTRHPALEMFNIMDCDVTAQMLSSALQPFLDSHCQLQQLGLRGRSFGNEVVPILTNLLEFNLLVDTLFVRNVGLNDHGIESLMQSLSGHCLLKNLEITETPMSDHAVKATASMLAQNRHLQTLSLSDNKISNLAAPYLAAAVEKNHSLFRLNLEKNDILHDGWSALMTAFRKNKRITNFSVFSSWLVSQPSQRRQESFNFWPEINPKW